MRYDGTKCEPLFRKSKFHFKLICSLKEKK